VWNKLQQNITFSYFSELIILFIFLLLIIIVIDYPVSLLIAILTTVSGVVLIIISTQRRRKELAEIKELISGIRSNKFNSPGQIHLSKNLESLENEIKQMVEKTRGDIDYLRRLERMRTEFIANVSHELRTPIFTIQGFIETLLNGAIDDKEVSLNFLEKANQHTINLSSLVNDLIDISMIESGEMRMSFRYFRINDMLAAISKDMISLAHEKGVELNYTPVRENLQILGDKNRLRQVLVNLISNAIKYTEKGKVDIIVEEEPKNVIIKIKDTGIGIAENDKDRIFERFYRVDKARSKAAGGTGLGLSIVKHIIEAHSSKIEVKSEVNEGSEFTFRLKK